MALHEFNSRHYLAPDASLLRRFDNAATEYTGDLRPVRASCPERTVIAGIESNVSRSYVDMARRVKWTI